MICHLTEKLISKLTVEKAKFNSYSFRSFNMSTTPKFFLSMDRIRGNNNAFITSSNVHVKAERN